MQIDREIGIEVDGGDKYDGGFFPLTKIINTILAFLEKIFNAFIPA